MTKKIVKALLFLSLASLSFGERRTQWTASKEDREIELRWSRPANNSCEIDFRDLQLRTKTSLTATIGYLPHKTNKRSVQTETAHLVLGGPGSNSEHIVGCESVVSVGVSGVSRE